MSCGDVIIIMEGFLLFFGCMAGGDPVRGVRVRAPPFLIIQSNHCHSTLELELHGSAMSFNVPILAVLCLDNLIKIPLLRPQNLKSSRSCQAASAVVAAWSPSRSLHDAHELHYETPKCERLMKPIPRSLHLRFTPSRHLPSICRLLNPS